jgi:mono/diheme cytochrome c family protein
MAIDLLTNAFALASEEAQFVDEDLLYVAGGILVLLALSMSFLGMRKKDFPSSSQLKVILPVTALVVVITGYAAIQTARFEQAERRAENEEAAKESQEQELENEEALGSETEGEAADPESGTGATPEGEGEPMGSTGGTDASIDEGRTIFTDTGCSGCHTLADAGSDAQTGPELDAAVPELTPDEVRTAIIDPGAEVAEGFGDGIMPATYGEQLDEVQIDTLVNYLVEVTKG